MNFELDEMKIIAIIQRNIYLFLDSRYHSFLETFQLLQFPSLLPLSCPSVVLHPAALPGPGLAALVLLHVGAVQVACNTATVIAVNEPSRSFTVSIVSIA